MVLTKKQLEDAARCHETWCAACSCEKTGGRLFACLEQAARTALTYREMLERLEWILENRIFVIGKGSVVQQYCPICGKNESKGHAPNCELAALLRADDTTDTDTAAEAMARVAEHDGTADKMARGE
jgi:hypothetical protein